MRHVDGSRKFMFKPEPDLNPWPVGSKCVYFYSSLNLGLGSLLVCFLVLFGGPWSSVLIIGIKLFIIFMAWRSANFAFFLAVTCYLTLRNVWSLCLTMHLKKTKNTVVQQCWNPNRTTLLIFLTPLPPPSFLKTLFSWQCCLE